VIEEGTALVIVDMQNYYLSVNSSYYRYFTRLWPESMDYIINRCRKTVIPNIRKLQDIFHKKSAPVFFLRLCGADPERKDLHRFFRDAYLKGLSEGYADIYPLKDDPMSEIIDDLKPDRDDRHSMIIRKTTYSAFTSSDLENHLRENRISTLVFTGLATSQCVETTARDASDRGYTVIHIEDAQADYDEISHKSSLYSSQGVCGGIIYNTEGFIEYCLFP
jgi:nicotinamidase-related amidase